MCVFVCIVCLSSSSSLLLLLLLLFCNDDQQHLFHLFRSQKLAFGLILQESISSIQEAGSSLVPPLPPAVSAVIRDIMLRVMQLIYNPDLAELNTSRHSLAGNSQANLSHHRSLDTLPLTHSTTKQYGSNTDIVEGTEQDDKMLFARALSNMVCIIHIF